MKKIILDKTFTFTPKDNKKNILVEIPLDKNYDSLVIEASYSPKDVDDLELSKKLIEAGMKKHIHHKVGPNDWKQYLPLKNHITLSLDFEEEYLGAVHRHAQSQKHIISETFSSPGFKKHKIIPGKWKIAINIHAAISSEINYHIKITGLEGEDYDSL